MDTPQSRDKNDRSATTPRRSVSPLRHRPRHRSRLAGARLVEGGDGGLGLALLALSFSAPRSWRSCPRSPARALGALGALVLALRPALLALLSSPLRPVSRSVSPSPPSSVPPSPPSSVPPSPPSSVPLSSSPCSRHAPSTGRLAVPSRSVARLAAAAFRRSRFGSFGPLMPCHRSIGRSAARFVAFGLILSHRPIGRSVAQFVAFGPILSTGRGVVLSRFVAFGQIVSCPCGFTAFMSTGRSDVPSPRPVVRLAAAAFRSLALGPSPSGRPCPVLVASRPSCPPADWSFRRVGFDAFGPIRFHRSIGRLIARFVALGPPMSRPRPPADWSFRCRARSLGSPPLLSVAPSVRHFRAALVLPWGLAAFLLLVSLFPARSGRVRLSSRLARSSSRRPVLAALVAWFSSRLAWSSRPALVASGCRRVSPAPRPRPLALLLSVSASRLDLVSLSPPSRLALAPRPCVSPSLGLGSRHRRPRVSLCVSPFRRLFALPSSRCSVVFLVRRPAAPPPSKLAGARLGEGGGGCHGLGRGAHYGTFGPRTLHGKGASRDVRLYSI